MPHDFDSSNLDTAWAETKKKTTGISNAKSSPCSPLNTQSIFHIPTVWYISSRDLPGLTMGLCPNKPIISWKYLKLKMHWDFPGGTVVKNPPDNARDMGSSPGPGRSHMPLSNYAHVPQLLSLRSVAREPQLLSLWTTTTEARVPRACALQKEKPLQWEARAPQWRVAPPRHN